jgi:hypothetical protein
LRRRNGGLRPLNIAFVYLGEADLSKYYLG